MSSETSRNKNKKCEHPMEDVLQIRLLRLTEIVSQLAGRSLAPKGLRNTDLRILNILFDSKTLSINELSRRTHVDKAWISRSVVQMLGKKLIKKQQNPKDARVQLISLSSKGRKLLEQIRPQVQHNEKVLLKGLSETELKKDLDMLLHNAEGLLSKISPQRAKKAEDSLLKKKI